MDMTKLTLSAILASMMVLGGCASKGETGKAYLADGVSRNADDTYRVDDGHPYPTTQAVQQCLHHADKRVSILTSVGDKELKGTDEVTRSFRCL